MSAAPALALATASRGFVRYPVRVALDVILLRSGVPESLPGRCTDLSEGGVGGMVAGDLASGQQVALELRLPDVAVPIRARASVRYQEKLRYGFEFVGLSADQQEMIRYWTYRHSQQASEPEKAKDEPAKVVSDAPVAVATPGVRIRFRRWHFNLLLAAMLLLAAAGWWQWQRSWHQLEVGAIAVEEPPLRVTPEAMQMRIVSRTEPAYPMQARHADKQGIVVLDAVIAADGTVKSLKPISGDDRLVKSAVEAVRLWKFEPYQSSGRAVAVETSIAVEFKN